MWRLRWESVLDRDGIVQRLRANQDDCYIMSTPPKDIEIESRAFMSQPACGDSAHTTHELAGRKQAPAQ